MAGTLGRVLRHMNSDHLASPGADDPRGNIVLSQKVIFCCLGPAGAWGASHGKIPGFTHQGKFMVPIFFPWFFRCTQDLGRTWGTYLGYHASHTRQ